MRPSTSLQRGPRIKTDHISSFSERPLSQVRNEARDRMISRMLRQRQAFNSNTETKEDWVEAGQLRLMKVAEAKAGTAEGDRLAREAEHMSRTLFNKSSVPHNIISWKDQESGGGANVDGGQSQTLNRNINFHKPSISEFMDKGYANALHEKQEFKEAVDENPRLFRRITGMCTFFKDAQIKHQHCVLKPPLRSGPQGSKVSGSGKMSPTVGMLSSP